MVPHAWRSMNIPQSAIEPFGYAGIPSVKLKPTIFGILNALNGFIKSVEDAQRIMGMDGGADPEAVTGTVEKITRKLGVEWSRCFHMKGTHYRLEFKVSEYKHSITKRFIVP